MVKQRERRDLDRVPVEIFLNQYVDDRLHRAVTANVSPTGLYVNRLLHRRAQLMTRGSRFVQLEFALPGTSDVLWALGEVRHDELELPLGRAEERALLHGTGIHLVEIARGHAQLLHDFVAERKRQRLQEILALIRHNRYH
jgi:hypothetical protein